MNSQSSSLRASPAIRRPALFKMPDHVKLFFGGPDRIKPVVSADMVRMSVAVCDHIRGIQIFFDKSAQVPAAIYGIDQQCPAAAPGKSAADTVVFLDLQDVFEDFGVI